MSRNKREEKKGKKLIDSDFLQQTAAKVNSSLDVGRLYDMMLMRWNCVTARNDREKPQKVNISYVEDGVALCRDGKLEMETNSN